MRREEAEAAAAKREAHKPRHLSAKRWEARFIDGVKGWQPKLVDCPAHFEREASKKVEEARRLLMLGDARFLDVAGEALLARCKAALAYTFDERHAQGMSARQGENSRSEVEGEARQPGPAKQDAPND